MENDKKITEKKVETSKVRKGKFPIVEMYGDMVYVLVDGQVNVAKYSGKDKKYAVLEYEIIDGKHIFK